MHVSPVPRGLLAAGLSAALTLAACGGGVDAAGSAAGAAAARSALAERPLAAAPKPAPAPAPAPTAAPAPPRAPVEPLEAVAVPDVNGLGLLDRSGPNAAAWPKLTNAGQQGTLRQLGKALFWDMQVGGDGLQACASCHFNAGADSRVTHQLAPGGPGSGDTGTELAALNARLTRVHFGAAANGRADAGFAVNELARIGAGAGADAADGTPGAPGPRTVAGDLNDIVSSHGVRAGTFLGVGAGRQDLGLLATADPLGFDFSFSAPARGIPHTVRRVAGRNSPSVLNAVYNLRNFWDGRADMFFNGVNTLGFRDPDARVKTFQAGTGLGAQRLDVPFSSLASQAVGPIGSDVEMVLSGRAHRDLGRKLTLPGVVPLAGQAVSATDSLLGALAGSGGRGLSTGYDALVRRAFDQRFWGDGRGGDVCLDAAGNFLATAAAGACPSGTAYTMLQWNFALFFGLGVQAYEATLHSGRTMVDLIAGGIATGTVSNGAKRVDVTGLALDGCIATVALNTSATEQATATRLCAAHYARFIPAGATSGAESAAAPNPVPRGAPVGGCATPPNCSIAGAAQATNAASTLLNVSRGLDRFFAGATACAECHFNPEFTGATVSALTGFGAQLPPLPPGQARRDLEQRALMERMVAFNARPGVYDSGFYNLGARPTPEDLSIGASLDGLPLALGKLFEVMAGGSAAGLDAAKVARVQATLPGLRMPAAPGDLSPAAFPFAVGCGPGVVGGTDANNNPIPNCVTSMVPGERLIRHGAFKTPGLRNVKFTGPYLHNGSKASLRQVLEFYKAGGHFRRLNANNMDAAMKVFTLDAADEAALVELLETGLTDWRVAYQQAPFDHPELCVTNGQDAASGRTRLAGIPAVGRAGSLARIATFEERLTGAVGFANDLSAGCMVPGLADSTRGEGSSTIDVPPTR